MTVPNVTVKWFAGKNFRLPSTSRFLLIHFYKCGTIVTERLVSPLTSGEKLLLHRKKLGLTQKRLAELSGVSEISIRKYELGLRNPKPVQLKKLAKAMEIGENSLLEIEVADISVETLGDFLAILFQFIEKMGCYVVHNVDGEGHLIENSTSIAFKNPMISEALSDVYRHFELVKQARKDFNSTSPSLEAQEAYNLSEQLLIENMKRNFIEQTTSIIDSNSTSNLTMLDFTRRFPPESDK